MLEGLPECQSRVVIGVAHVGNIVVPNLRLEGHELAPYAVHRRADQRQAARARPLRLAPLAFAGGLGVVLGRERYDAVGTGVTALVGPRVRQCHGQGARVGRLEGGAEVLPGHATFPVGGASADGCGIFHRQRHRQEGLVVGGLVVRGLVVLGAPPCSGAVLLGWGEGGGVGDPPHLEEFFEAAIIVIEGDGG